MFVSVAAQAFLPQPGVPAHPAAAVLAIALVALLVQQFWSLRRQLGTERAGRRQDHRLHEEFAAYMQIDLPRTGPSADLARLVSHRVSTCSSFSRVAVLFPDATGELRISGSSGMDDLSMEALHRWAASAASGPGWVDHADRAADQVFRLTLERRAITEENAPGALSCPEVLLLPLGSPEHLLGCIALCPDVRPSALPVVPSEPGQPPLSAVILPLQSLAARLSLQLGSFEKAASARAVRPEEHTRLKPRRGPRHGSPASLAEPSPAQSVQRRTLDRTDPPGPAAYSASDIRRLLEQNAPRGLTLPPRNLDRMGGFPPSRVWKGATLPRALASL